MFAESRIRVVLASIFGCLLLFSPAGQAAGERPLGRVLYSQATTLRGLPVPGSETILSGDLLTTAENGSALVELKSGTKVKISQNSSVRFVGDGQWVQAELLSGAVVSESAGKPTMVVTTPKYDFAPAQEGECRYLVQLSKEQATVAGAMEGNLLVTTRNESGSYVLREGNYASISASAVGVPGQATAAGRQPGAQQAGTVSNLIPDDVVQRQGQGAETALKVNDGINWQDVVRTLQNGRLRIAMSDGSYLNMGTRSTMKIIRHEPKMQQTQIELTAGSMRAWVVNLTQPGAVFEVQTRTAVMRVLGTDFIVNAQIDFTAVYCLEGVVSVQNIDPAIPGQVTLHSGEYTGVARGLPPSNSKKTPAASLLSETNRTSLAPGAGGPAMAAGWHIDSLSEAASVGLVVGMAAATAGAIVGVVVTRPTPPPPVSPSAP